MQPKTIKTLKSELGHDFQAWCQRAVELEHTARNAPQSCEVGVKLIELGRILQVLKRNTKAWNYFQKMAADMKADPDGPLVVHLMNDAALRLMNATIFYDQASEECQQLSLRWLGQRRWFVIPQMAASKRMDEKYAEAVLMRCYEIVSEDDEALKDEEDYNIRQIAMLDVFGDDLKTEMHRWSRANKTEITSDNARNVARAASSVLGVASTTLKPLVVRIISEDGWDADLRQDYERSDREIIADWAEAAMKTLSPDDYKKLGEALGSAHREGAFK